MLDGAIPGTVTDFDVDRGLGHIRSEDGTDYLFHLVEIVDGTRTIEVGQAVTFERWPKLGRFEAARIRKV
jgi:cold shock CspA family protein